MRATMEAIVKDIESLLGQKQLWANSFKGYKQPQLNWNVKECEVVLEVIGATALLAPFKDFVEANLAEARKAQKSLGVSLWGEARFSGPKHLLKEKVFWCEAHIRSFFKSCPNWKELLLGPSPQTQEPKAPAPTEAQGQGQGPKPAEPQELKDLKDLMQQASQEPKPVTPVVKPRSQELARTWHEFVLGTRKILEDSGLPLFGSPRFSFAAAKFLLAGDNLEEALEASLWQGLPSDMISMAKEETLALARRLKLRIPQGPQKGNPLLDQISLEGKHFQAGRIIRYLRQGAFPFIWGSPGAGKSHLIQSMAEDMGLPFCLFTANPDSTKSEFVGSISPINFQAYLPKFAKFWEEGGVILMDEIGLAQGQAVNILNGAKAQGVLETVDGRRISRHENFFMVYADNSNLWGTDPRFSERQDLGAAFRDRLAFIKFEYDNDLQLRIEENLFSVLD